MEATPLTAAVTSPPSQRGLVIIAFDIALLLLLLNTLPF